MSQRMIDEGREMDPTYIDVANRSETTFVCAADGTAIGVTQERWALAVVTDPVTHETIEARRNAES